ncbi:hypothetical protein B0H19DRAFT_1255937 [Mycena capillaripes]|nr:hypothetical protein B0H19DRAFT_1255937 [Mycena capillaripes]
MNPHNFTWSNAANSTNDTRIESVPPAFVYDPRASWHTAKLQGFDGHVTNQSEANVTFTFSGDRVALYGAIAAGGRYTAQLNDSERVMNFIQLNFTQIHSQPQLIFYADSLPAGNHTVRLVSESDNASFTVSHAVIGDAINKELASTSTSSSSSSSPLSTGDSANTNSSPQSNINFGHGRLSDAQFIGIMVGVALLVTLLLVALGYILYLRRKRRNSAPSSPHEFNPAQLVIQPLAIGGSADTLSKPRENVQTRFFEPGTNWTNSFYSQSSITLDEGYQPDSDKREVHSFAYSAPDSLYSEGENRPRSQSVDCNSIDAHAAYAM